MNIIGFVKKYGNLTFQKRPFDEIDSLLLSQLSYLNWRWLIPNVHRDKRGITLGKLLKAGYDDKLCRKTLSPWKNKRLLAALRNKTRYEHIVLCDIWDLLDEESENQFFAVTFLLPNRTMYIAYRGTDITLIGWKEDLNMAYDLVLPSHHEAIEYFKFIVKKFPNRHFYLGGHSKGGNLAVYVAFRMNKIHVPNLIKVYSHDGPGFLDPNFTRDDEYKEEVLNKIEKTVPYHSIIGMLLYTPFHTKIVRASSFYIFQHDIFNWQINPFDGGLYYLKERSIQSKVREEAFRKWISSLNVEDKKFIVDSIYEVLGEERYTVVQLFAKGFEILRRVHIKLKAMNKHQQKLIKDTIKFFIEMYKTLYQHPPLSIDNKKSDKKDV